ncbi:hypothetical protein [Streptomyces asoensis]|uniref:HEAT repeat protein n=1 Tax=Streptomyces asoensis TaxID=249586 RepID=A0ABQ3S651_9ACTN|nr:hypothetical protein [Streptomyces asoensis]GGQ79581.1 hypothetical protein GCM10010496_49090 [Streptomyces asoensis]GHI63603.1 hypothetical protein Saso_52530 [Streptomyces asoensis]
MSSSPRPDWAVLHHAYGRAEDVPGRLAALSGADPVARGAAVSALSSSVCHQGTRWPASAHVVTPLVALVDTPATPDRPTVVHLLHAVALGEPSDDVLPFEPGHVFAAAERVGPSDEAAVLRVLFENDDPDPDTVADVADAVAVRWAADAYHAAERHTPSFTTWLQDPEPAVAARAAALLAWFPRVPALATALAGVGIDTGTVRASANLALAFLPDPPGSGELAALTASLASTDETVRVSAAVALARRRPTALPDEALTVLIGADDEITGVVPGWDRPLRGHVALALQRLGL